MTFHPKGLLVSAGFIALLWFALERGFGLVVLAAVVAVLLDAVLGFGLLNFLPDLPRRRVRRL